MLGWADAFAVIGVAWALFATIAIECWYKITTKQLEFDMKKWECKENEITP